MLYLCFLEYFRFPIVSLFFSLSFYIYRVQARGPLWNSFLISEPFFRGFLILCIQFLRATCDSKRYCVMKQTRLRSRVSDRKIKHLNLAYLRSSNLSNLRLDIVISSKTSLSILIKTNYSYKSRIFLIEFFFDFFNTFSGWQ